MQQQSELQIAAEQADNNEKRLKTYRAKRNNSAPYEGNCTNCGSTTIGTTKCQQCRDNKQQELQEAFEHPYA